MNKQSLKYGHTFCAIEHGVNGAFYLLQLQKKKKELVISKQESFLNQETLLTNLKGQKHVFLIVNNEQVLSKSIDFVNSSEERVVKTAFPNIGLQDFYYQTYQSTTSSQVAICRKEVLDKIIKEYLEKGISIIDFSLGNLEIKSLLPYVENRGLSTSNAEITLENKEIVNIDKGNQKTEAYQINGLEIQHESTLALAGVISYYSNTNKETKNTFQKNLEKEYQQKRFFALGLKFSLGFLFAILLINFLVFSSYREEVFNLETELTLNETYKKQLIRLNDVVTKKKKLVESITSASNSKVIWYFDQISETVPKTLLLSEVNYQPIKRTIKEDKQIQFQKDQIDVKGVSRNDTDLTEWIEVLRQLDWIEKISFVNYGKGKTKRTSFDFVIQMKRER